MERTGQGSQEDSQLDPNYGSWVLVTRRKNLVRNGCVRNLKKSDEGKVDNLKGKVVITGNRWDGKHDDTPQVSLEEDMPVTKADQARENVTQHQKLVITEGESEVNRASLLI